MKEEILRNYAKLIARVGGNIKEGQEVEINANVNTEYFVKYVVEECYNAGASIVTVQWASSITNRIMYEKTEEKYLCQVPSYTVERWNYRLEHLPVQIHILSEDPDCYKGLDTKKLSNMKQASGKIIMPIRNKMENKYQWTIVAIPSIEWARKVFPNKTDDEAVELLWDAILKTARVYGDPIENWNKHNDYIHEKCNKLNNLELKSLHYLSSNGTDFNIDLLDNVLFTGAGSYTVDGKYYNPNMPTEECFTSPDKDSANGIIYAAKPLSLDGNLLKDFGFRFENGKVVEVLAKEESTKKTLEQLVSLDEGAKMLGEVALVPYDSPVNQTNLIFYNTLFDENACCHLALGRGFEDTIKDFEKLSEEELKSFNINKSMIHVDFMVGTTDLKIIGTTKENKKVTIFENGVWAI